MIAKHLLWCIVVCLLCLPLPQAAKAKRRSRAKMSRTCQKLIERRAAFRYVRRKRKLETAIKRYIRALRRCRQLKRGERVYVLVYDHSGCKVVAIRQKSSFSAASLIKLYVMWAVYQRAHRKSPTTKGKHSSQAFPKDITMAIGDMMQISDNRATNHLIREYLGGGKSRKGLKEINRLLRQHHMKRSKLVELIPKGGRTYRNKTSAADLHRFLLLLKKRRLISRRSSKAMLQVMLRSMENRGKTLYLRDVYHIKAATKTGYTRRTNGVAGIFWLPSKKRAAYQLVAVISRPYKRRYRRWWKVRSSAIIQRLSEMTYRHFALGHIRKERSLGASSAFCRR